MYAWLDDAIILHDKRNNGSRQAGTGGGAFFWVLIFPIPWEPGNIDSVFA